MPRDYPDLAAGVRALAAVNRAQLDLARAGCGPKERCKAREPGKEVAGDRLAGFGLDEDEGAGALENEVQLAGKLSPWVAGLEASRRAAHARAKCLLRLRPEESPGVLRSLSERHPDLVAEAEEIGGATVPEVEAGALAEDVERAVLGLDIDDLETRAGARARVRCSAGPTTSRRRPPATRWRGWRARASRVAPARRGRR